MQIELIQSRHCRVKKEFPFFVEKSFHNPFNGIWFAWETVTSVEYGDFYPTILVGKLVSIVIMLMGAYLSFTNLDDSRSVIIEKCYATPNLDAKK